MNPRFQPLLTACGTGSAKETKKSFQLKIVPADKVTEPFQSLAAAMSTARKGQRHDEENDQDSRHQPRIDLKKDGDKITRITVTCGCGEIMEIDCDYAP